MEPFFEQNPALIWWMFQVFYSDEDTIEDLKRKIDFLMSFRDFAELSFFFHASGDNFLRSFFLTFDVI